LGSSSPLRAAAYLGTQYAVAVLLIELSLLLIELPEQLGNPVGGFLA
jgi:hypothetical protein